LSYPNARKDCVACEQRDASLVFLQITTPASGVVPSETLTNPPLAPGTWRLRRPSPIEKLLCVPCFTVQLRYWSGFVFDLGRLTTTVVLSRPALPPDVPKPPYGERPTISGDCPVCGQDTEGALDNDPALCGECLAWTMCCRLRSEPCGRMEFRVRRRSGRPPASTGPW
jgi:hypothetical protein